MCTWFVGLSIRQFEDTSLVTSKQKFSHFYGRIGCHELATIHAMGILKSHCLSRINHSISLASNYPKKKHIPASLPRCRTMPNRPSKIRHKRRHFDVRRTLKLRGETYYVVGQYGRRGKNIDHVLRRETGGGYEDLVVHEMEDNQENWRRVQNLKRAKGKSLPFARVLNSMRKAGNIYVVVEHQPGDSLRKHLKSSKEISPFKAVVLNNQLVSQICNFMRSTGVIHGDISPDNLIVARDVTRLTIIDLGSSFRYTESKKRPAGDGDKPIYRAPELFNGAVTDHLSEQFSCSMVFYEMISRQIAYSGLGGSVAQTPESETILPPKPVSELNGNDQSNFPKHIWPAIDSFLRTTLSVDPEKRFQSMSEWQEAAKHLAWLVDPRNISPPKPKSWAQKIAGLFRAKE